MNFSAILFEKTQHVVKTSTMGYMPICYEIINLFIEPQNFLFMFFICKLKGVYLIVTVCEGLLMLSLDLFNSCIKFRWFDILQNVLLKCLTLVFFKVYRDIKGTSQWNENIMIMSVLSSMVKWGGQLKTAKRKSRD